MLFVCTIYTFYLTRFFGTERHVTGLLLVCIGFHTQQCCFASYLYSVYFYITNYIFLLAVSCFRKLRINSVHLYLYLYLAFTTLTLIRKDLSVQMLLWQSPEFFCTHYGSTYLPMWSWKNANKWFTVHRVCMHVFVRVCVHTCVCVCVCMCGDVDKYQCSTGNLWLDLHHTWADYSAGRPANVTRSTLNCHWVVSHRYHFSLLLYQ